MTEATDLTAAATLDGTEILVVGQPLAPYKVTSLRVVQEILALGEAMSFGAAPSGAGITALFASPPAIGGTAAAAGTFTTLTSTGNTTLGDASGDSVTINAGTVTLTQAASGNPTIAGSRTDAQVTVRGGSAGGAIQLFGSTMTNFAGAVFIDSTAGSGGTNDGAIVVRPAGTEMTRTTSVGLLIGSASTMPGAASARLQVTGTAGDFAVGVSNSHASTPYGQRIKYAAAAPNGTSNEFLYCDDSGALRVSLRSNGGIANYSANDVNLSDERTKTDITPLASYWDKIKGIEVVTFKYIDQSHDDDNIGVIAQQVEAVAPEFVDTDGFGETPADGVPLKAIYTADMFFALMKVVQELQARVEALEAA